MVDIRVAEPGDDEPLARIDDASWSSKVTPAPRREPGSRFFCTHTSLEDVLVAVVDGVVAGYVSLHQSIPLPSHAHVLEINGLAVDPSFRGGGIGRRLVTEAQREAIRRGARKLSLRVLAPNTSARALYESCGFEVEGVLRGEFVLDGALTDDVLMACRLEGWSPPTPQAARTSAVGIALLTAADEQDLLAFELANRAFFARTIGDRGDAYFAEFSARHARLVAENEAGTSMLFSVRDQDGHVVGRVNIGPVDDGSGDLGYRIGEDVCGRGYAQAAVGLAVRAAAERGLLRIHAMTTEDNAASRRVLEANGFVLVPGAEPVELEVCGRMRRAVHLTRALNEVRR
jgi:RimJ/RimL family protein N-acetyltransferase